MNQAPCNHVFNRRNLTFGLAALGVACVLAVPGQAFAAKVPALSYGSSALQQVSSRTVGASLGSALSASIASAAGSHASSFTGETSVIKAAEGSTVDLRARDYVKYSRTVYGANIMWRLVSWTLEMPDGTTQVLTPNRGGAASFTMPDGDVTVCPNYMSPLAGVILKVGEKTSFADLASEVGKAEILSATLVRADDSPEFVLDGGGVTLMSKTVKENLDAAGKVESKDVTYTVNISAETLAAAGIYTDLDAFYRFNGVVVTLDDYGTPNNTRPDTLPVMDEDGDATFTFTVSFANPGTDQS